MGFRPKNTNVISHVTFVVDESDSIRTAGLTEAVKEQILKQIQTMVDENTEKVHEIRGTLYTFQGDFYARSRDEHVHCVFSDMDIVRMQEVLQHPGMHDWYQPGHATALIDATMKAIEEMEEVPTRYGSHNYLVWVVSDGMENASVTDGIVLQRKLRSLPNNWRVGVLVPNEQAKQHAVSLGFNEDNVLVWDAASKAGLEKASKAMQAATSMTLRGHRTGEKQTGGLFSTGAEAVNVATVKDAGLKPVPKDDYERLYAHQKERIDVLVDEKSKNLPYKRGNGFYQLTKRETIQAGKKVLVWDRTKKVLLQGDVRGLLNLPEKVDVTIPKPEENDRYEFYVQSKADNRVIPEKKHGVIVKDANLLS